MEKRLRRGLLSSLLSVFQEISVPVRKPVPLAAAERPSVASQ
ncbi:hypothetical protein ACSLNW_26030 [Escherichia coli]